jgi:hypothetical protein
MKATGACCVGLKALVHHFPLLSSQMTNQHPITPPPELVHQWADMLASRSDQAIFTMAAQWGADQELEAMMSRIEELPFPSGYADALRAACRPEPPSLKEQALEALEALPTPAGQVTADRLATIRRALEALDD